MGTASGRRKGGFRSVREIQRTQGPIGERRMRETMILTSLLVGLVLVLGCSETPLEEIRIVEAALQDAQATQAADYAPETMQAAEDARARLEAEMKAQEEKMAPCRSYKAASQIAAEAKDAAIRAAGEAEAGKVRVKDEAESMIASARTVLAQARSSLRKAPTGKGSQSDIAMMKADLNGVAMTLDEADGAYLDERYLVARIKAEAARTTAEAVREDIDNAIEITRTARRRP